MKFSKYIKYPVFLSLLLLLTGCINDEPNPCPEETRSMPVKFTILLSTTTTGTRSEGDDGKSKDPNAPFDNNEKWDDMPQSEDGFPFDNKIESAKVFIYSTTPQGELNTDYLIGSMTASAIVGLGESSMDESSANYSKYEIQGMLETSYPIDLLQKGTFRMIVMANTGLDDISDLGTAKFSRHGVPQTDVNPAARIINAGFTSIPMYGVGNVRFDGLSDTPTGEIFNLKDESGSDEFSIAMLRSMAKIRVKIGGDLDTTRGMKLKSLKFSRHSAQGYFVPNKWNSISSIYDLKLSESLNVIEGKKDDKYPTDCETDTEGSVNNETMIRFYVPDTYNIDNGNQFHDHSAEGEIVLTVTYVSDGDENEKYGHIYLRPYSGGKPVRTEGTRAWDIIRNHIYEYEINELSPLGGEFSVSVSVNKWKYHKLGTEL